ncbi:NAD-dependent epimerase/dehydratase family protein [Phenylobacterium sp.]|uniref:NAD-dependent epimerase/dehydratase family protein n=1 Tax=Phenylobacterium sp. TaxID=1871053 RepID=UPI0025F5E3FB|nr:NAD-dependent epimerase/dehydratase family protein [Phenylobacterium sp.]MCA3741386.1 NAD-dependent epimerase/dehydratase family protein [Phenylobacterium sp.]
MGEPAAAGRVLVTGGAGFIGRRLTARLVTSGARVRVLDDLSTGDASRLHPDAELRFGSILDPGALAEAVEGVEAVYHLAAIASVARCNEDIAASHQVNLGGFVSLIETVLRQPRRPALVFASSAAVYGDTPDIPLGEDSATAPLSPYGADKLGCELHARAAARVYGLKSTGLRFFNVYGPGQDPGSPYSGVISRFARLARDGAEITIFGDGGQTRDFVFVDDVVDALMVAAGRTGGDLFEALNVCTGQETSILDLARRLAGIHGATPRIAHQAERPGDIRRSLGSPERLAGVLGVTPSGDLDRGLRALLSETDA